MDTDIIIERRNNRAVKLGVAQMQHRMLVRIIATALRCIRLHFVYT